MKPILDARECREKLHGDLVKKFIQRWKGRR